MPLSLDEQMGGAYEQEQGKLGCVKREKPRMVGSMERVLFQPSQYNWVYPPGGDESMVLSLNGVTYFFENLM